MSVGLGLQVRRLQLLELEGERSCVPKDTRRNLLRL